MLECGTLDEPIVGVKELASDDEGEVAGLLEDPITELEDAAGVLGCAVLDEIIVGVTELASDDEGDTVEDATEVLEGAG
jgi:hypothetical protein